MDQILHADRNQTSSFAGKSFATSAAVGGRQAKVRAFPFGHAATLRGGDGSFKVPRYANEQKFDTHVFTTKPDRAAKGDAFTGGDRAFATKALPVVDAPGSGKSAGLSRDYLPGQKLFEVRGKRQDTIDEIHNQKDLTIDEVREILNKPNGRPGAPRPEVGSLPVMRALPVPASSAQ